MTTERPRSSPAVWLAIATVVLLPAIYALGVGPASWLCVHGYLRAPLQVIYWPIRWLQLHSELVRHVVDWYLSLWL
jgi:hypothetical protein